MRQALQPQDRFVASCGGPHRHRSLAMLLRISGFLVACLLAPTSAWAAWYEQAVEWSLDGEVFSGVLVYDDSSSQPRPGLLMVPNWMGVNASAIERAREIAG